MKCLTIQINKRNKALSQFKNFSFNSLVKFNGMYLASSPAGLFKLGNQADTDAGTTINWAFTPVETDFGADNSKHLRYIYYGGNFNSEFTVTATPDNKDAEEYTVSVTDSGQQRTKHSCKSNHLGRYWKFEFAGTGDFDMDAIELLLVNLHHGHR